MVHQDWGRGTSNKSNNDKFVYIKFKNSKCALTTITSSKPPNFRWENWSPQGLCTSLLKVMGGAARGKYIGIRPLSSPFLQENGLSHHGKHLVQLGVALFPLAPTFWSPMAGQVGTWLVLGSGPSSDFWAWEQRSQRAVPFWWDGPGDQQWLCFQMCKETWPDRMMLPETRVERVLVVSDSQLSPRHVSLLTFL